MRLERSPMGCKLPCMRLTCSSSAQEPPLLCNRVSCCFEYIRLVREPRTWSEQTTIAQDIALMIQECKDGRQRERVRVLWTCSTPPRGLPVPNLQSTVVVPRKNYCCSLFHFWKPRHTIGSKRFQKWQHARLRCLWWIGRVDGQRSTGIVARRKPTWTTK
jgi:hypothetical protein